MCFVLLMCEQGAEKQKYYQENKSINTRTPKQETQEEATAAVLT